MWKYTFKSFNQAIVASHSELFIQYEDMNERADKEVRYFCEILNLDDEIDKIYNKLSDCFTERSYKKYDKVYVLKEVLNREQLCRVYDLLLNNEFYTLECCEV